MKNNVIDEIKALYEENEETEKGLEKIEEGLKDLESKIADLRNEIECLFYLKYAREKISCQDDEKTSTSADVSNS